MKISSKMERCGLSPMRKFNPYAQKARERGIKIYPLNIGQPDVETPAPFYQALKDFDEKVVSYAPSGGLPVYLDAVRDYYRRIGVELERGDILPTTGGSEALQMTFATILDDGDEVVIPEPFYPNYHTSVTLAGAKIHPIPTSVEEGYFYADRARVEACINEHTRALFVTNPGNPTGSILSPEELKLMLDIAKEHDLYIICDEVYASLSTPASLCSAGCSLPVMKTTSSSSTRSPSASPPAAPVSARSFPKTRPSWARL